MSLPDILDRLGSVPKESQSPKQTAPQAPGNVGNAGTGATGGLQNPVQRVLFLAPEWGNITKVGGLADVVASLSTALQGRGIEVRPVLLGYRHIRMRQHSKHFLPELPFFLLEECSHPDYPGQIFYLLKHPALETVGEPYSPSYADDDSALNMLQAILLGLAPFAIAANPAISWQPQVVHCHDWLSSLFPYCNHQLSQLLPAFAGVKIPSLLTIHNAAYMGIFGSKVTDSFPQLLQQWGMAFAPSFSLAAWHYRGQVNLLAAGLRYAEKINTVSPTHARELLCGDTPISSLLQERRSDFSGILNGVDSTGWNPASDPYLQGGHYTARKREVQKAKVYWRKQLQERLQFELNPRVPLLISICRIVEQKGLDELFSLQANRSQDGQGSKDGHSAKNPLVEALEQQRCQLIVLGEGEPSLEFQLQLLSWQHSDSFLFLNYFHEEMAHILTAAADFCLMPSRYEPCGLNQIYALHYGTTPIVRHTGGLADTVQHLVNGLVFLNCEPPELQAVLEQAFSLWRRKPKKLWEMKLYGMEQDFSWQANLDQYIQLYSACQT